jgi:hypothetical protein
LSDNTIWCSTCGQYATDAIVGLRRGCHHVKAGTRHQLRLLCSGTHPGTRRPFDGVAIPEHEWQSSDALATLAIVTPDLRHAVTPRGNVVASRARAVDRASAARHTACAPPTAPVLSDRVEALRARLLARTEAPVSSSSVPAMLTPERERQASGELGAESPPSNVVASWARVAVGVSTARHTTCALPTAPALSDRVEALRARLLARTLAPASSGSA